MSSREKKWNFLEVISVEPAMFLFMCSALAKFPIFQSLLYEKACLNSGRFDLLTCQNITATHADLSLQKEANHLLLASSLCLLLPSIPTALLLGALFDSWNVRKSLLIPLGGLFLADINYVLQSLCTDCSAYWLLISDLFYGFAGGFTSIIGLLFAYSVRATSPSFRSSRATLMEGSMGLGGMCGYILSGQLRQKFGYAWVFLLLTLIHFFVFFHILFFVRELSSHSQVEQNQSINQTEEDEAPHDSDSLDSSRDSHSTVQSLLAICRKRMAAILDMYKTERESNLQKCLNIVLLAFAIELTSFSGLMDILFSFLRFQLQWTDKEYGWFNGIGIGLSSFVVIVFYPLLQKQIGISDVRLVLFGLITKMVSILILAFSKSTWLAIISIVPSIFGRFISTGLRALASACVEQKEQGKVFSLISLIEAVAFLIASFLFNGIYPYTLHFFAGTMLIAIVCSLLIPVALLVYIDIKRINQKLPGGNVAE